MAFEKLKIYSNNVLRQARTSDDGTDYATCAEALEVPDNAFAVQGDIVAAEDVPSVATLEGCEVRMDTTGNRYGITDSDLGPRRTGAFNAGEAGAGGPVLIIKGTDKIYYLDGISVFEQDPDDLSILRSESFSYQQIHTGVLSDDEKYLFLVVTDSAGLYKAKKLSLADWSEVASVSLDAATEVPITGARSIATETAVYVLVKVAATNVGAIVHLLAVDLTKITTAAFNATELSPTDLAYDATNGFLYASGIISGGSNVGLVVKVNAASTPIARTAVVNCAAGELLPAGICLDATDIYITCKDAGNVGILVKFQIAAFTRTGAVAYTEYYPGRPVLDATYVYSSARNLVGSVSYVVRFNIAGFTRTGAVTLTYDLTAIIAIDATNIYCVHWAHYLFVGIGVVAETVDISSFTVSTTYQLPGGGPPLAIADDGEHVYSLVAIDTNGTNGTAQIMKHTKLGAHVATIILSDVTSNTVCYSSLYVHGSILYVGTNTKIIRVNKSSFTEIDSLPLAGDKTAMLADDTYLFVLVASSPSTIERYTHSPFTFIDTVTFNAGENTAMDMDMDATHIYAVCLTTTAMIVKSTRAPFARVGVLSLAAGENSGMGIVVDGAYFYVACSNGANRAVVSRCVVATFLEDTATTLDAGEEFPQDLVARTDGLYVSCYDSGSNYEGSVVRLKKSTLGRVAAYKATADQTGGRMVIIDDTLFASMMIYGRPELVLLTLFDEVSLFDRLQEQDIGDNFTIRAGLACAQCTTDRPVGYAADGHLTPVMKGLVNTELHLRMHAPNLIEDGGFESGAFSPNWTAGANWAIESTAELEGKYSAAWDLAASNDLQQVSAQRVRKGRTYTVLFKAQSVTANPTAGAIAVRVRQSVSGTNLDSDVTGYQPAITTAATWFSVDVVPDFDTDDWYVLFDADHTLANGATKIIIDEVYVFEKKTVNSLIIGRHNLIGRSVTVNAWRLSPLRSTAAVDANNKAVIGNAIPVDTIEPFMATLTTVAYPVIELVIPAVAAWQPEIGELYIGDYWQLPNFLQSPFDPYAENADGLRTMRFSVKYLNPALRKTTIADLFAALKSGEAVWVKWDTDTPLLMESPRAARTAPFSPYMTDLDVDLVERL